MSRPALLAWLSPTPAADGSGTAQARTLASIATRMDRASVDLLVLDDVAVTAPEGPTATDPDAVLRMSGLGVDPATVVPFLGAATRRMAFAPGLATSIYPPFMLARMMSTVDWHTGGRVAWNVLVPDSGSAAAPIDLGSGAGPRADEYARAADHVAACRALWNTWEPGSLVLDTTSGQFGDPARVHPADYAGPYFTTRGPLNTVRTPQGPLPVVHVPTSDAGYAFAAEHADVVVLTGATVAEIVAGRQAVLSAGRSPVLVAAVTPFTALTDAGAAALRARTGRSPGDPVTLEVVGSLSAVTDRLGGLVDEAGVDGLALATALDAEVVADLVTRLVPALRAGPLRALPDAATFTARLAGLRGAPV